MMSIQKPGRNRVKVTSSRTTASHQRLRVMNQPCVAAAKRRLAMIAVDTVRKRCPRLSMPISKSCVLKMNMNGRIAVRML